MIALEESYSTDSGYRMMVFGRAKKEFTQYKHITVETLENVVGNIEGIIVAGNMKLFYFLSSKL